MPRPIGIGLPTSVLDADKNGDIRNGLLFGIPTSLTVVEKPGSAASVPENESMAATSCLELLESPMPLTREPPNSLNLKLFSGLIPIDLISDLTL